MNLATLLIVDDEKSTRDGLRMALEDHFDCYVASGIKEAMAVLKSEPISILLTDLRLSGESGMDLLDQALTLPQPPVSIMMTAYGSVDTAVDNKVPIFDTRSLRSTIKSTKPVFSTYSLF